MTDRLTNQPTCLMCVCVCGRHISIFPFHLSVYLQSCYIPLPYLSFKDDKFKRCGQECWRCQPADRTPSPQEKGGGGWDAKAFKGTVSPKIVMFTIKKVNMEV